MIDELDPVDRPVAAECEVTAEQPQTSASHGPATWVRVLEVLGVTAACAVVCDAAMAVSLRIDQTFPVFLGPGLLGLACMWIVVLTVFGLTGRLRPTVVIMTCSTATFAAINAVRMHILDVPLSFRDLEFLQDPGFLVDMVGVRVLALAATGVVALGLTVAFLVGRVGRHRPAVRRGGVGWRWWIGFRSASVVLGLALVVVASGFNGQNNSLRAAYEASGATWKSWSQADNYRSNGFFGGLFYNLPVEAMERPAEYTPERMAEIAAKWERLADERNTGTDPDALAGTNVVVVLSETMGDPTLLDHVRVQGDPLPHVRGLMEKSGGHMLASYYGSGTSAMEFQVLTGQTLGLFRGQISAPYQQFVTDHASYPNAAGWLGSLGHRTIAVHPFSMHMYRRPQVYETFGFDEVIDEDSLQTPTRLHPRAFISDQSAYDEVLHHLDRNERPIMVNLVTMQNHMPYGRRYRNPFPVEGTDPDRAATIGQWARGLQISDRAVDRFLREVKARDERTVVVQFGDHFPAVFDLAKIAGEGLNVYRTPFFVWDSEGGKALGGQGQVSPSAALEIALRRAGISLPPYFALLAEVQEKVGTVRHGMIVSPEGERLAPDGLDEEQQTLLEDLRMVQYDFSIGERYALESMWYSPEE